ncbi:PREDICTED: T-complex protein 1 subunit gamma-like [Lipotes vexillifer]|uniref:CCT-gamma n=1 Tax=Lipotes vexillifer TaxID=118797 RepID=A0A340X121_LIPVE|nr:PREDICTED: T-complex protein 1 subunit gamma-like [Lipotes vexillifer]
MAVRDHRPLSCQGFSAVMGEDLCSPHICKNNGYWTVRIIQAQRQRHQNSCCHFLFLGDVSGEQTGQTRSWRRDSIAVTGPGTLTSGLPGCPAPPQPAFLQRKEKNGIVWEEFAVHDAEDEVKSPSLLSEVERNLQDATMQVCCNVLLDPQLVPGGRASEMAVAHALTEKSKAMTGVEQWPYRAVAQALEVIPRTLIQNRGASTIRLLTSLRAKHTQENCETWGVNGETGTLVDMRELGIWEPLAVKLQMYKTALETAVLLLRIDDIVSGHKKKGDEQSQQGGAPDGWPGVSGGKATSTHRANSLLLP